MHSFHNYFFKLSLIKCLNRLFLFTKTGISRKTADIKNILANIFDWQCYTYKSVQRTNSNVYINNHVQCTPSKSCLKILEQSICTARQKDILGHKIMYRSFWVEYKQNFI